MRKIILTITITILVVAIFGYGNQEQERILEEVEVLNVLVPVRVFFKGDPVDGLKKEDFQIYENGKLQKIDDFQIISRKINIDKKKPLSKREKSRFFIIIFNVFDFNQDVEKGIDSFFKKIYKKTDKIVILTPERIFNIENSREMIKSLPVLKRVLKIYSKKAKNALHIMLRKLESQVNQFFESYFVDTATKVFLTNYKRIWNEYSRKYLIPDIKKFYQFADFLKNIKMDKWVIVFQQKDVFPQFKSFSRIERKIEEWITGHPTKPTTPVLEQMLERLKFEFKISYNFPLEEIKEAFFKANATFHVLLFKSFKSAQSQSQDFEFSEAVSDYENSFKTISRATGGDIVFTNKLSESLERISEKKDVHYILSYAPKETHKKKRKIKVKVKGSKRYNIFYINRIKLNPEIEEGKGQFKIDVKDFSFRDRTMKVSLIKYLRKKIKEKEKEIGLIDVSIIIMDSNSEEIVYNKSNTLEAVNPKTNITIKFNSLRKGKYHLILDLYDKLARKSRLVSKDIRI